LNPLQKVVTYAMPSLTYKIMSKKVTVISDFKTHQTFGVKMDGTREPTRLITGWIGMKYFYKF